MANHMGTRWGVPSGPIDATWTVRSVARNSAASSSVIRMRSRWLGMAENPARGAIDFPLPAALTDRYGGDEVEMQAERYPTDSALLAGAAGGGPDAGGALGHSIGPGVYGFVFARGGG